MNDFQKIGRLVSWDDLITFSLQFAETQGHYNIYQIILILLSFDLHNKVVKYIYIIQKEDIIWKTKRKMNNSTISNLF